MPAPDVAALLAELERTEPELARAARLAIDWLAGGRALETISQLDLCEFLWYTLPLKISGDRFSIARALGELLRLGGLYRYAAMCRSRTTARILRTYARDGEEAGVAAYHRALKTTGVLPPDTSELTWSSIMGPEEGRAHASCAAALELAIVAGEMTPDERAGRERLTRRWLTTPRAELGGDCWLDRVHGERLNRWVLGHGSARRELAEPFELRLHAPIPVPREPHLEPLRWLLELAENGIPLTERLNLARAVAVEAVARFGWEVLTSGSVRSETEVPALTSLKLIAIGDLGALRRTGRRLVLTRKGRKLLANPEALWSTMGRVLLTFARRRVDHRFEVCARESALMLVADGPMEADELYAQVAAVLSDEGWRTSEGTAVTHIEVARPLNELRLRLDALRLRTDPKWNASWRLTPVGRAAALAALRAYALRPRRYLGDE